MYVCIASMKGGVGKSTIASMLAKHVSDSMEIPATVIDMDPQRGATIILLGPKKATSHSGYTIYDVLQSELDKIPSHEILSQSFVTSSYHEQISVVPASAMLGRLAGPGTPRDLLHLALSGIQNLQESLVIIDTGPDITLCEMSIVAADLVYIPITLSHQTGIPTLNTLNAAFSYGCRVGGLIPTMVGDAKWSDDRVDQWRGSLLNTRLIKNRNIPLLPSMPYSQSAIRGTWRWGKIPKIFTPLLEALKKQIFSHPDCLSTFTAGYCGAGVDIIEGTL
ncbi:MAG: ParA family protein [Anaerolineales bacterium]